jgi:hypothetical protein
MLEYKVKLGDSVFIRWQGTSIDTGLFPQAKIYSITAPTTVVATLNLPHLNSGLYGIAWTPTVTGKYFTQTIIYSTDYGVDESGIDRPDSDSINVEEISGGSNYLFGAAHLNKEDKKYYEGLTHEEINKIIIGVTDSLKVELAELLLKIKESMPVIEKIDYSGDFEVIKKLISKIKFDYQFDDSEIIDKINSLDNKVSTETNYLSGIIKEYSNREIKIEKKITQIVGSQEDGDDQDLIVAKDIIMNPEKRFEYSKNKKLNNKVIEYLLCLRGSC